MSIFTFEHILCLLLILIYPAVHPLNKDLCELGVSRYSTWVMPKRRMEGIFVYVLEYMLTFVSLDKMQNIGIYTRKSSKSEGRAFWKFFKWNLFKLSSKVLLLTVPRRYFFGGSFVLFLYCVCHAFPSTHCCLVVTCWEGDGLLALVCGVKLCGCYFPIWYPGSGVVLDCIDSWYLPPFLLSHSTTYIGFSGPVTGS